MWKTLALGAALTVASSAAFAAPQCKERDDVLELLSSKYAEAPVAVGVANNGGLVEVLSTGDGDTWSIMRSAERIAASAPWLSVPRAEPGQNALDYR